LFEKNLIKQIPLYGLWLYRGRVPSRKAKYYCTPIANKYREGKFKSFAKQSEIDLKSGTNKHKESKRDNLVPSV